LLQIVRMAGLADRVGDIVWLNDDDVREDDDAEPTLRVPHYASIAVGELVSPLAAPVSEPPRRSSRLLLRAVLFLCAVAIVFELGWWGGSRLASQSAPPLAATKSAPMRIELHKAPHTLAPPEEEPQPQAPVQKQAPKFFGFLVPTPAATAAPAPKATVFDPSSL
jgi:hypothetical protein